jgi:error-prone DNA polymerase
MGFHSPQSLVADARRHGVQVHRPNLQTSGIHAALEPADPVADEAGQVVATGNEECLRVEQPAVREFDPEQPFDSDLHRRDGRLVVRLGLVGVKSIGLPAATTIVEEREKNGPYADMSDLVRRTGLTAVQVEALATAGAFDSFGLSRRQALWNAGRAAEVRPGICPA